MPGRRSSGSSSRLSDAERIEAFSDGVFAIAITLLTLNLRVPASGHVVDSLRSDWTSYVAYFAAFLTISSNWVHHHDFFRHVARTDATLLVANLLVLLGVSIIPWPTALIAAAIRAGQLPDQVAAIWIYAATSLIVTFAWIVLTSALIRRPDMLDSDAQRDWLRRQVFWQSMTLVPVLAAAALAFVTPLASLFVFLILPLLYIGSIFRTPTNMRISSDRRAPKQ